MEDRLQDIREPNQGDAPKKEGAGRLIIILIIIAIVIGAAWMYYDRSGGFAGRGAAAVVNGFKITNSELSNRIERSRTNLEAQGADFSQPGLLEELKKQVTEELVNERLVLQDAEKKGLTVDQTALDGALQEIRGRFSSEEEFKKQLADGKLSEDAWRESVRRELIIQKYIADVVKDQNVSASAAEIETYYDDLAKQQPEGQAIPKFSEVKEQLAAQIQNQKVAVLLQARIAELKSAGTVELK